MAQFEQQKQSWSMLAKQIIVDTESLDNKIELCRPLSSVLGTSYAEVVAKEILTVLDIHFDACVKKNTDIFARTLHDSEHKVRELLGEVLMLPSSLFSLFSLLSSFSSPSSGYYVPANMFLVIFLGSGWGEIREKS